VSLTQDDEMIEALAPDLSDQPFGKTVLPRRRWCDGFVSNAHGVQSARKLSGTPQKAGVPKNQKNPDSTYAACVERLEIASPRPVPPFLRVMASLADP
jgi:hypothetical protein